MCMLNFTFTHFDQVCSVSCKKKKKVYGRGKCGVALFKALLLLPYKIRLRIK